MNREELKNKIDSSSFSRSFYRVDVPLSHITTSIASYTDYDNQSKYTNKNLAELIKKATPEFQRKNDKWSMPMREKFVENLLCGFRTDICLFRVGNTDSDAMILDGLQRLTALAWFFDEQLDIFGNTKMEDIIAIHALKRASLGIKIYDFATMEEAVRFYIDMNENITHSAEDIRKAKDWLRFCRVNTEKN